MTNIISKQRIQSNIIHYIKKLKHGNGTWELKKLREYVAKTKN